MSCVQASCDASFQLNPVQSRIVFCITACTRVELEGPQPVTLAPADKGHG